MDVVARARAIGAASKNKDWQFAAKHWDRVDDPGNKAELLRLAQAAVDGDPSPRIGGLGVGDWFRRNTDQDALWCRIAFIPTRAELVVLEWWKNDGSYHVTNAWQLRGGEFKKLIPSTPPPFKTET